MEKLIEKQKFYISEFEEETAWLSFMHREGWKFVSTTGNQYEFEACEQEDWVYQLDFKEKAEEDETYIRMFADYGWEYVTKYGQWFYFRKKKEGNEDLSIFSDRESKIEMCKRVVNGQLFRLLPLTMIFMANSYVMFFTNIAGEKTFLHGLLWGIGISSMIVMCFCLGVYLNQVRRLNQKIKKLEDCQ